MIEIPTIAVVLSTVYAVALVLGAVLLVVGAVELARELSARRTPAAAPAPASDRELARSH